MKTLLIRGSLHLALMLGAAGLLAQTAATPSPNWGTSGLTSYSLSGMDLVPFNQATLYQVTGNGPYKYLSGGPAEGLELVAGVHLPQGASVEMIEVSGCDNDDAGFFAGDFSHAAPPGDGFVIATVDSIGMGTPGCTTLQKTVAPPFVVNNSTDVYWVDAVNSTFDGSTYVTGIRIWYRLQVSPAPDTATFNDVPTTDPGFQYIEALAASGITGGCGGGNYCPDNPVTRRQMAIFLAKALGLYWPN